VNCHSGRSLAGWGSNFANIGLDEEYTDNGLGERQEDSNGMFKVPSLRNIALTAPYMHDGRFATLEEVGHLEMVGVYLLMIFFRLNQILLLEEMANPFAEILQK